PTIFALSLSVIESPAVPLPVIDGVVTLVRLSPAVPLSEAGANASPVGAAGGVVSIVSDNPDETALRLPAASVSVAVSVCAPSDRALAPLAQVPPPATVAVLIGGPVLSAELYSLIVSPVVPFPVIDGVVTLVMWSPAVPLSEAGANASPVGGAGGV